MIALGLTGVAVRAPGLGTWAESCPILAGRTLHDPTATLDIPLPSMLSPNERRRAGPLAKLALSVCEEASLMAGHAPGALASVFGSSNGDGAVVHDLLDTLASPDPLLSPTRFHNSVHNAVAGYWAIATRSSAPVTCLGCHDATFAAALLKAAAQARSTDAPVLLCVYDAPMRLPLGALRTTTIGFAAAFVLTPTRLPQDLAYVRVAFSPSRTGPEPAPIQAALRLLWQANPVARALVLLEAIASGADATFGFPYAAGLLMVESAPR
ncbi:beta-ketoacyl synthase chain length factor [Lichenicoccus sp.]|uniref:beta-ketoacyl synthase chain length factor n=1 Tax=Lichenicoccus sp. TaxID=2781899 RepID=UPI003D102F27